MAKYRVYYDSGTTNSRIYLLDDAFNVVYADSVEVGSKDSATSGSNKVLLEALKGLYDGMLEASGVAEADIQPELYGSGMLTSPHGLMEIPHLLVPVSAKEHAQQMKRFHEDSLFHRDFILVPGLKTAFASIQEAGNMRGEEMEILGVMDPVDSIFPGREVALMFPGSHTHTVLLVDQGVRDILSQMTGELFFAMRESTLLATTLKTEDRTLHADMVKQGMVDTEHFGFNRAIYIAHAMNVFNEGSMPERRSYAEGVLNYGLVKALAERCQSKWTGCESAVIVSNDYMFELYSIMLEDHPAIKEVAHLTISRDKSYAIDGLKKLLEV